MTPAATDGEHGQRGPTARQTYFLIQILRAVAALMVVVHHAILMLGQRDRMHVHNWINGGAGVDIFFVISGFVMTISSAPLRHARHPARTFLARRLERILPLYWLATTVKIGLVLLAPALAINALGTRWHVIASYLLLPSYAEPVVVVGWTLIYEMAFYVLFALVLGGRLSFERVLAPLLLVIGLSRWLLAGTVHVEVHGILGFYNMNTIVLDFLYGVLLALGVQQVKKINSAAAAAMMIAGGCVLFTWVLPNFSYWRGLMWGLPAAAVVAGAIALERTWGPKAPRWMLELGDASYSIYLVHGFVLPVVGVALKRMGTSWWGTAVVSVVVMTVASALVGDATYRVVERPITQWFKGRRRTAVPANA